MLIDRASSASVCGQHPGRGTRRAGGRCSRSRTGSPCRSRSAARAGGSSCCRRASPTRTAGSSRPRRPTLRGDLRRRQRRRRGGSRGRPPGRAASGSRCPAPPRGCPGRSPCWPAGGRRSGSSLRTWARRTAPDSSVIRKFIPRNGRGAYFDSSRCGRVPLVVHREAALVERLVVGHDHAAVAAGDRLVLVEAVGPDRADAADAAALVRRAERLGAVLDERDPVAVGDGLELRHPGRRRRACGRR